VSLKQLRNAEESLRRDLEAVRGQLATALGILADGEAAEHAFAAMADVSAQSSRRKASEGVYRDPAVERAEDLRERSEAGQATRPQRERLRKEESRLLTELEKVRREIEWLGIKRSALPLLQNIPNATPCALRWDEMTGDGDVRACPQCKTTVFNVAMLQPAAAEALLGEHFARALHRRKDGTVLSGDCPQHASATQAYKLAFTVGGAIVAGVVAALTIFHAFWQ
jgi:hypothetical protein